MKFTRANINQIGLRYGLILAAINIIWGLVTYLMEVDKNPGVINSILSFGVSIISVVILVQGIRAVKNIQNGFMTYSQSFKTGAYISIVASIVYGIYIYFYFKTINPEYIHTMIEKTLSDLSGDELEKVKEMTDLLTPGILGIGVAFTYIIGGVILTAVVSAVLKNDPPRSEIGDVI